MPLRLLQTAISSRTKWRRLSSRLFAELHGAAARARRLRAGGSDEAGVRYQLGANVPAERRHAPRTDLMRTAVGQMMQRRRRRDAGEGLRHYIEVFVVALDPVEGRSGVKCCPRCSRRRRPAPTAARSACRAMIS
mgnify:CR=1 FL=1